MPVTLTGTASAITARTAPTIPAPASADFPSDTSNNQPDQALLDKIASLLAHAGLLDVIGTYTQAQTFSAGATISTAAIATANVGALNVSGASALGGTLGVTGASTVTTITASGLATFNAQIQVGGTNADGQPDKRLHPGLITRGWIRLAFNGNSTPTKQSGRNIGNPLAGGSAFFSVDCDANLGNDVSVQMTGWDTGGSDYAWDLKVNSVSVVSSKTRITFRVTDPTSTSGSGKTPPTGTGCYIEVKSAN